MYNGGPDISDISMQPSEGGTTSLPSIHFPSGEEGGEETTYSVERDGMPRVTKSGIYLGSRLIRFSEARTKKALLLSGIQPGQLQPRAQRLHHRRHHQGWLQHMHLDQRRTSSP